MPFSALAFVLYPSLVVMISPFPAFRRNRNSPRACTGSWCRGPDRGAAVCGCLRSRPKGWTGYDSASAKKMVDIFKTYEVPLPG